MDILPTEIFEQASYRTVTLISVNQSPRTSILTPIMYMLVSGKQLVKMRMAALEIAPSNASQHWQQPYFCLANKAHPVIS